MKWNKGQGTRALWSLFLAPGCLSVGLSATTVQSRSKKCSNTVLAKRDRSSWYGPGACYAFVAFTGASPPDLNLQLTGDDEETSKHFRRWVLHPVAEMQFAH